MVWTSRRRVGFLAALPVGLSLVSPQPPPTAKVADAFGLLNGWAPKPTIAPQSWLGHEPEHVLYARQETLTCGYFDHDPSRPNLCERNSACMFDADRSYFGCCENGETCYNPLSCKPHTSGDNAGAQVSGNAVLCGSEAPECQTTVFPTVNGLAHKGPYTHFDCVTSATSVLYLYQDTTHGASSGSHNNSAHLTSSNSVHITLTHSNRTSTVSTTTGAPREKSTTSNTTRTRSSTTSSESSETSAVSATSISNVASSTASSTDSSSAAAVHAYQTAAAGVLALAIAAGRIVL